MLDIFTDYYLQLLARAQQPSSVDEGVLIQVANSLLKVLASRATQ
jgi:hypothetical protein